MSAIKDVYNATTDKIKTDIQSLAPDAVIELYKLDMSHYNVASLYFHAGTNSLTNDVVWQGITYSHMPVEAEGFAIGSNGTLPRPKFRLANPDGAFGATVALYNDLIGCTIVRRRTLAKYLDAVNFAGSVNATADPNQHYPDEVWFVDQKVLEGRIIEWELASAFDLSGVLLPGRQVNQNACPWVYRGVDCGYTGNVYANSLDVTTVGGIPITLENDVCGKRLRSCELRFGQNATLPFGGFPGSIAYS